MKWFMFLWLLLFMGLLPSLALAQTPTAAQYLAAGNESYLIKDYAKALEYYQTATQLDQNNAAAFQGLGNSDYMLGQKAQALTAYEKASVLDPANVQLSNFIQNLKMQLVATPSIMVATPTISPTPSSGLELDLMGGLDVPVSPAGYGLSFGGGADCYFLLNSISAIGASLSYYSFSYQGGAGSASEIELLAAFKYRFGNGGSKPYLVLGAGLSDYNDVFDGSVLNPAAGGGLGYEFNLGSKMNAFIEAKAIAIIASNTTIIHIPIGVGINFNL
jgi:tetratricopeptide (TPR) repeat protein